MPPRAGWRTSECRAWREDTRARPVDAERITRSKPGARATLRPVSFRFRAGLAVSGADSHWKECPGACADTNSCWSCVPTSRTTRPRRSSTAPPARSSPPAARSSRSPRGAAAGWPTRSTGTARARTTSSSSRRRPTRSLEMERGLLITEEVLRHLVTRDERPARPARRDGAEGERQRGRHRPAVRRGRGGRRRRPRADRRVRDRGGSGRDRLRSATMALCKVMIIGNLGADPEMRYTPNGRPVTQFSVAVNQSTKNQQTGEWVEETDWFRVSVWGDRAERAAENLRKGNRVFVEGRFQTREYEGRDGQKRTSLEITADSVVNLEKRTARGRRRRPVRRRRAGAGARALPVAAPRGGGSTTPSSTTCPSDPDLDDLTLLRGPTAAPPGDPMPPAPLQEARRLLPRPTSPEGLRLLRRQDRPDRLQGGQPPPPLPLGAGEDRAAPEDRHLRRAPARAGRRPEAGPDRRAPAVRAAAPPP